MHKQQGLSLVELMISIVLGLILMTGVMNIFISSKVVFSTQQAMSRIQETGRLAVDFIARDVRMVGYYGGARKGNNPYAFSIVNAPANDGLNGDFDVSIRGYDSYEDLAAVTDLGELPGSVTPVEDTSVLVVRAANQQGVVVTQDNTPTSFFAYTTATAKDSSGCVGNICEGGTVVVSDSIKAHIFKVSTLTLNGSQLIINHANSWGGDNTNPLTMFGLGAEILPLNTTVYFLAKGASGTTSLYQKINKGSALELLEGVENMSVTYSSAANVYQQASATADWEAVRSAHVELLVRSLNDNVLGESQDYEFSGVKYEDVEDRRMRKKFITSVVPRSRMVMN